MSGVLDEYPVPANTETVNHMTRRGAQVLPAFIERVALPVSVAALAPNAPSATAQWAKVDVWRVVPERVHDPLESMLAVLDPSERERAHYRRTAQSRRAFAIAHVCLRELLAAEIGIKPGEVEFARPRTPFAKPALADRAHGSTFNLSHTDGLILIALTHGLEVGVDVEWLHRHVRVAALSRRYFTASELSELKLAHSSEERVRGFLQLWTRREAHSKMTGEGLRRAITRGREPDGPFGGTASWVGDLEVGPDHVGALAVQAHS